MKAIIVHHHHLQHHVQVTHFSLTIFANHYPVLIVKFCVSFSGSSKEHLTCRIEETHNEHLVKHVPFWLAQLWYASKHFTERHLTIKVAWKFVLLAGLFGKLPIHLFSFTTLVFTNGPDRGQCGCFISFATGMLIQLIWHFVLQALILCDHILGQWNGSYRAETCPFPMQWNLVLVVAVNLTPKHGTLSVFIT